MNSQVQSLNVDAPAAPQAEVGVVIGTYNNQDHVAATLASLRSQVGVRWTCVLVDNGSTDSTVQRLRELIDGDARFRLVCKSNEGPSAGRNFGWRELAADVEFVHFLDGDDALAPAFLATLVAHLRAHPEVGLVACQFDVIDSSGHRVGAGWRSRYAPGAWGWPRALRDDEIETPFAAFFAATGQGPFALFRASVFRRTTGYEVDFWSHEDSDIFCQMALLAPVHQRPERLYRKRVHGHNLTASPKADYAKFRRKWDCLRPVDAQQERVIEHALRYYHGVHAPLRHFKVAALAARECLQRRTLASVGWCLRCTGQGVIDLFGRHTLRKRLLERRDLIAPISK